MITQETLAAQRRLVVDVLRRGPLAADDFKRELGAKGFHDPAVRGKNAHEVAIGAIMRKQALRPARFGEPPLALKTEPVKTGERGLFVLNPDHPLVRKEIDAELLREWRQLLPEAKRVTEETEAESEEEHEESSAEQSLRVLVAMRDLIAALVEERAVGNWFVFEIFPIDLLQRLISQVDVTISSEQVIRELLQMKLIENASQNKRNGPRCDWSVYMIKDGPRLRQRINPDVWGAPDADAGREYLHQLITETVDSDQETWLQKLREKTADYSWLGPQRGAGRNREERRAQASSQTPDLASARTPIEDRFGADHDAFVGMIRDTMHPYTDDALARRIGEVRAELENRTHEQDKAQPLELMIGVYESDFKHLNAGALARQLDVLEFERGIRNIEHAQAVTRANAEHYLKQLREQQRVVEAARETLRAAEASLREAQAHVDRLEARSRELRGELHKAKIGISGLRGLPVPK